MRIAIATPAQVNSLKGGQPRWLSFHTEFVRPSEIRRRISLLLAEEEATEEECHLVTMNRTVLDLVTASECKNVGPIIYEDVLVWSDEQDDLVPLLDIHSEEWLVHFSLGDIINREL